MGAVSMNRIVQRAADQAWHFAGLLLYAPAGTTRFLRRAALITILEADVTLAAAASPTASALAV